MTETLEQIKLKNDENLENLVDQLKKASISNIALVNPKAKTQISINMDDDTMMTAFNTLEINYDEYNGMIILFNQSYWEQALSYGMPLVGSKIIFRIADKLVTFTLYGNEASDRLLLESIAELITEWIELTIKFDKIEFDYF